MKKVLFLFSLVASQFLISCSVDEENPKLDVSISAIENASINFGETENIKVNVIFNNDTEGNISLSLEDVPTGIEWSFTQNSGSENFETDLILETTNELEGGTYPIKIVGETSDGSSIEQIVNLTVIKNLSASVNIMEVSSWTIENPKYPAVSNVELNLYNDSDVLIKTTDSDAEGKVMFYNLPQGQYYITINSETYSLLADKEEIDDQTVGFLINGVFETQEDIDNSPEQSSSEVGEPKYVDLNADFIINGNDKTIGKTFSYENDTEEVDIYLIEK